MRGGVGLGRLLRVENDLDEPGAVAQVDEHEAAVVAAAMHPAGDPHDLADRVRANVAAPGVPVLVRRAGGLIARAVNASYSSSAWLHLALLLCAHVANRRRPRATTPPAR